MMETQLDAVSRQKKLYFFNENLREMHSKLDYEIQQRIPLEYLLQLCKFKLHKNLMKFSKNYNFSQP